MSEYVMQVQHSEPTAQTILNSRKTETVKANRACSKTEFLKVLLGGYFHLSGTCGLFLCVCVSHPRTHTHTHTHNKPTEWPTHIMLLYINTHTHTHTPNSYHLSGPLFPSLTHTHSFTLSVLTSCFYEKQYSPLLCAESSVLLLFHLLLSELHPILKPRPVSSERLQWSSCVKYFCFLG